MKSEKIYDDWKEHKSQIEVGENFAEKVISQVYQYEQKKTKPLFDMQRLVELVSVHPLAKAGLIAAGALVGLLRLAVMLHVLLYA